MNPAKDAIGNCTCKTCAYFHQPVPGPAGLCIWGPPTPVFMGMAPVAPGPLVDPSKPTQLQPMVNSYFPIVQQDAGCGRHPERAENKGTIMPWRPTGLNS